MNASDNVDDTETHCSVFVCPSVCVWVSGGVTHAHKIHRQCQCRRLYGTFKSLAIQTQQKITYEYIAIRLLSTTSMKRYNVVTICGYRSAWKCFLCVHCSTSSASFGTYRLWNHFILNLLVLYRDYTGLISGNIVLQQHKWTDLFKVRKIELQQIKRKIPYLESMKNIGWNRLKFSKWTLWICKIQEKLQKNNTFVEKNQIKEVDKELVKNCRFVWTSDIFSVIKKCQPNWLKTSNEHKMSVFNDIGLDAAIDDGTPKYMLDGK